jgi:hypothetical protein
MAIRLGLSSLVGVEVVGSVNSLDGVEDHERMASPWVTGVNVGENKKGRYEDH